MDAICEHCWPDAKVLHQFKAGWFLILQSGRYKIVDGGMRRALLVFGRKPIPDSEENEHWDDDVYDGVPDEVKIQTGWDLIEMAKAEGWTGRPVFDCWLFDYCGKIIQEKESQGVAS